MSQSQPSIQSTQSMQSLSASAARKRAAMITLRSRLDELNWHLRNTGLKPLSLSSIASAVGLSKSTVAAVINDVYHSRTAQTHHNVIAAHIMDYLTPFLPHEKPSRKTGTGSSIASPRKTGTCKPPTRLPRAHFIRVSVEGYLRFRGHHYYAGPGCACCIAAVYPIPRDRDHYIRACFGTLERTLGPVDPTGNQLNYRPELAA